MRNFSEADKKNKQIRIQTPENPANLSEEAIAQLENRVKAELKEGYLPCPAAWKIARDANVPKIAVGEITDRLGIRIINCQIGCFKVDKTVHDSIADKQIDDKIIGEIEILANNNKLTCANVFELARKMKLKPMAVADMANARNMRVRQCQLGCF